MLSFYKRPFGGPNAVIYSYQLSKYFLDPGIQSILEVGCGIGIFVFRYASSHPNVSVTGVDYSSKTIDFLSSNSGNYYQNLKLEVCDFCQDGLDLGGPKFDAVYTSDVLEHVQDTRSFVSNLHSHLRAGGKAVVNFPNETNHGINHFDDVDDIRKLFHAFSDVAVFLVRIQNPGDKLWFGIRAAYESLFSRSTKQERVRLYAGREEQGIDYFEESTCFKFVDSINRKGRFFHIMASGLAEMLLLIRPTIDVSRVEQGTIRDVPRLVVVATK